MHYKVITPPEAPVISLDKIHLQLKLGLTNGETHPEDDLFLTYLESARKLAQHETNRAIGAQTIEVALDAFPDVITLPVAPFVSMTSIVYLDANAVQQTLSPSAYAVDDYGDYARILPLSAWPAVASVPNAIKVRYVAGDVPANVQDAMLLIVAYRNRVRGEGGDREMRRIWLGSTAMFSIDKNYNI